MDLPVMPPLRPMLAKSVKSIPRAGSGPADHLFEPKWDGFRCLVFKDGDEVELTSRNTKSLTKYFPEVAQALGAQLTDKCVLDGEVFVARGDRLDFDCLQARVHPAASRIKQLSVETPAGFVGFDCLASGSQSLLDQPMRNRREQLAAILADVTAPLYLTQTTQDPDLAQIWFDQFEGAGLDGLMAKPLDSPYTPNARTMLKLKHQRTADVVLGGYRLHKDSTDARPLVGSLLLGLFDAGQLRHVGVCASFTLARRAELIDQLSTLRASMSDHPWGSEGEIAANPERTPGTRSRWSQGKDLSFIPLEPSRVLEVGYDHMEGRRFRHTAQFKRWRPDRDPESCGYDQLEEPVSFELDKVLSGNLGGEQ